MNARRVLIVDDEAMARERMQRFLRDSQLELAVDEAHHGLDALEKMASFIPEVVFLDIQMPGMNGFDVLKNLEKRPFQIVFQTAYDEFALQAFEESAVDYLLKPYTKERFQAALQKALLLAHASVSLPRLQDNLLEKKKYLEKILIRQGGKSTVIEVEEIECFVSQDHYTCIYSGQREWISELSLAWLEKELDPNLFGRAHRSNIVCLSKVKAIGPSTDSYLELKSGRRLPLSRMGRKKVVERISLN